MLLILWMGCASRAPDVASSQPEEPPPQAGTVVAATQALTIRFTEGRLVLSPPPAFATDTTVLLAEGEAVVDALGGFLNARAEVARATIVVPPLTADEDVRYSLEDARAKVIFERLAEQGVAMERLAYHGGHDLVHGVDASVGAPTYVDVVVVAASEAITTPCATDTLPGRCYAPRTRLPWQDEVIEVTIPTLGRSVLPPTSTR